MPSGTGFDPQSVEQFEKAKLEKAAQGIFATAAAGQSTNIDLVLSDDFLLNGGASLLIKDAAWGDYAHFQVIHPTYGMIKQFITSWPINPQEYKQQLPTVNYPAKLVAGLTLRVVYVSSGAQNVSVALGYNLEKVLV